MTPITQSLVKLAQELCNSGRTPKAAVHYLLDKAGVLPELAYLLDADVSQAIAELERRFSGYPVKPWGVQP